MKTIIVLILGVVALGLSASAQRFTLLPQLGIENSKTAIQYNNLPSFSPIANQMSPYLGARLNYKNKQGHGAFVAVGTNHSIVAYNFSDVETGGKIYSASTGNYKLNLQTGYQFTSKPIYFNKAAVKNAKVVNEEKTVEKSYSSCRSRCGMNSGSRYSSSTSKSVASAAQQDKGWYVSIQPSLGAAFIPSVKNSLTTKMVGNQEVYSYEAGNYSYALVSGVGFEFGKNVQRKVLVSVNYLKGLGNLSNEKIVSGSDIKPIVTNLKSTSSSWAVTTGIPFTLGKKKQVVKQLPEAPKRYYYEGRCGKYKSA